MVHLARVPTAKEIEAPVIEGLESLKFDIPDEDEVTASVYGSRFAAQELPRHEMPEKEMPREIAYRMIKYALTINARL